MAELDVISETLRRHRKDLEDLAESTSSRSVQTAELLSKIEDLRARAEKTQRAFEAYAKESDDDSRKK